MNSQEITIIVPFYNRLALLEKTIQSILDQNFTKWYLILVDDCSEESTEDIKLKYSSDKVRFETRSREPKGAPTCRNIGAQMATTDFIMFLDSDDLLAPWALESRTNTIEKKPHYDLYLFEAIEFDNQNPSAHRLRTIFGTEEPLKLFLCFQSVWQTSCVVWRKEVFHKIGGWNEKVKSWQDGEIHIRYLNQYNNLIWGRPFPDVFIRKHKDENRISNQLDINKIDNLFETYFETLVIINDRKLHTLFHKNIENMLFSIAEGNVEHLKYLDWAKKKFNAAPVLNSLTWYIKLYSFFPKSRLMRRFFYQLRKIGIPNKRVMFWSIRPKLTQKNLQILKTKIKLSKLLSTEIKEL